MVGARLLLLRRFEPEATLRLIEKERITNTYLIPAMAKMVIACPSWGRHDLGSLRFLGSGGEAVSDSITTAFRAIGVPVLNSYGLTETADGTTTIRPYDEGKPAHCIGKPLPFVDIKVVNARGEEAAPGEEGEIAHRGPTLVEGYWHRPEETAKAFRDGWFFSGDIGTRDANGYLYFLARRDEMIVTGGENVYPAEVEQAILGHPGVADVAVLGVPHEKWGQTIKAIIAAKADETLRAEDIATFLEGRLSGFKRPRICEFVAQLPKIGSGKLDRKLIKATYGRSS
jgi:fatty-acyl-CoA synthase